MRLNPNDYELPKEVTEEKNPLDKLVPEYGVNKAEADKLKKITEDQNKQIKELLAEAGVTSYEAGGYIASVSTTEKSKFNDAKLLAVIKQHEELASQVIKTQEYVDMDALESVIYAGKVDTDTLLAMDKCKESTTVVSLRIKKAKKSKGEKNESNNNN